MGLYPKHLLELAVRPALQELSSGPDYLYSAAAEQIVMGTAAKESQLVFLRQLGRGPAVGLWQMEPSTFIWLRNEVIPRNQLLSEAFSRCAIDPVPEIDELAHNLKLAAFMCRVRYFAAPAKLPVSGDIHGHAWMWKKFYNTEMGAGTEEQYLKSWQTIIEPAGLVWTKP